MEWTWSEDGLSRSLIHGVEELCLDRSRDGVGQSRESDSSRESFWDSGGGGHDG
jgi:hypothetical protein